MVDEVMMTLEAGNLCGEDVLMDMLQDGRRIPRRKTTVNVTSECELLVLTLVDALQVHSLFLPPSHLLLIPNACECDAAVNCLP